ncbi:MAG: hypothetical protein A3I66_06430 [Burkholderiales bacterium RIFCSPLOWO2_02_FULL_57_36]|nr:MAG: hypothetical protein A3I66_06430 [Burkholderiales bacterium RIFCSPLOWO2_02_FULL_57_36]
MDMAKAAPHERSRLNALKTYGILDTLPEYEFDQITQTVACICGTPIATVTLVDERRQWFKSIVGLDIRETDRAIAFCAHAICGTSLFVVPDALKNPLFKNNPLVTANPGLRFYAGMPLIAPNGFALGALAVMDRTPRRLSLKQKGALEIFADQVMMQLELRRRRQSVESPASDCGDGNAASDMQSENLRQIAGRMAHIGGWNLDISACRLTWSNEVCDIHEVPHGFRPTINEAINFYTPESREEIKFAFATCSRHGIAFDEELQIVTGKGGRVWVRVIGEAARDAGGAIFMVQGALQDITEKKQTEKATNQGQRRFYQIADAMSQIVWTAEPDGSPDYINHAMAEYTGIGGADPAMQSWINAAHGEDVDRCVALWRECIYTGEPYSAELRLWRASDATPRWHIVSAIPIRDEAGAIVKWYGNATDIDDRKVAEAKIHELADRLTRTLESIAGGVSDLTARRQSELNTARLNRALRMRTACNELLIRTSDETELLNGICRLTLDIGGYWTAWVGYAHDDEAKSIKFPAYAGIPEVGAYLSGSRHSWSEDDAIGRGPAGKTIRSGAATIIDDLTREPSMAPWFSSIKQYGFRGGIYLPLRDKERTFGLLAMYSSEVLTAPADEIKLLQDLADDLAFGISNIRSQEERRRLQAAVLKVAAVVSASSGTEFFEHLARNMAEAVGAQGGFVARLLPGDTVTGRMMAIVVDGVLQENFDYGFDGTPCMELLRNGRFVVPADAARQFPRSPSLGLFGAQAYVGARLDNSAGQPVGLLYVQFRDPLKSSDLTFSTLQIFAARAAAELERESADVRIRNQASLLDKAQDAIIVRGMDNLILFWNKSAERLYGWTSEEAIGNSKDKLLYEDSITFAEANSLVMMQGEWSGEAVQRRKDGSTLIVESRWTLVKDDRGMPQSILAINTDITQRKAAEQQLQHLAFYDPLTRLPNRLLLLDRLQHALSLNVRTHRIGALLFIDLDNFKTLNDTLGHEKGDLLLQQVATRLSTCVRDSDTVARLGGDEFVVMLESLGENLRDAAAHTKTVGGKILDAFTLPYYLAGHAYHSTPSIGATLFTGDENDVDELLKRADLAMYQAKASGRNTMRFFDPKMQTAVTARVALEADFRLGLQQGEFLLHYQPQVNSQGCVVGAEALVRWKQIQRGMVSPEQFIPLAEETGLILPLGQWVLETACAQLAVWAAEPDKMHLTMAVNVSICQFRHPEFVELVLGVLQKTGADPTRLKLELTESLLIHGVEDAIAKMSALKARGVGFSLDDFGTGYSSLSYLKRLPLDQLKIDQSFVRDVANDPNDAAIVRTIIALGQSLGLAVIAEGVETEDERDFLNRNGCHTYQGYLYSQPLPIEKFEIYLDRSSRAAA